MYVPGRRLLREWTSLETDWGLTHSLSQMFPESLPQGLLILHSA